MDDEGLPVLVPALRDRLLYAITFRLPRDVIMWAAVRLGVHATSGRWSQDLASELTMAEVLERWHQDPFDRAPVVPLRRVDFAGERVDEC